MMTVVIRSTEEGRRVVIVEVDRMGRVIPRQSDNAGLTRREGWERERRVAILFVIKLDRIRGVIAGQNISLSVVTKDITAGRTRREGWGRSGFNYKEIRAFAPPSAFCTHVCVTKRSCR